MIKVKNNNNKYQRVKIYKLVNSVATDGNYYYGSTCNELRFRKYGHKKEYKRWKNGKRGYVTSLKLFEDYENVDTILVEKFPCNSKHELNTRNILHLKAIRY